VAARLGNVLYWLGCGIAAIFVLLTIVIAMSPGFFGDAIVFYSFLSGIIAVLSWLAGRACRYVLAGI
jgi:hypothetical protein